MNARQLQYAVILSETKNFSAAAEKLNISQPAFSKQIIALENELGIKLFDRCTNPLLLTPAGEFFIEKAKTLLFEEEFLLKSMEDYKTGGRGRLVIGAVPFRSSYMMPGLIKVVKDKYPKLQVVLLEYGLSVLKQGLLEGAYDFAIMNLPIQEPMFETIPLQPDTLMLAVPDAMKENVRTEEDGVIQNLGAVAEIPFVTVGKEQEMRNLFDALCKDAGIDPAIYATVTGVATAWEVAKIGAAATLVPGQFAKTRGNRGGITLYEIKETPYVRQPAVVLRRGQFVSEYARFAIETLKKQW